MKSLKQRDARADVNVYNVAMKTIKNTWNYVNKYPLIGDGILTLLLALWVFFTLRAYWDLAPPPINSSLAVLLITLEIIPLIWRRVFPCIALIIITIAVVTLLVLKIPDLNFMGIISMLAVFSASAYGGRRRNVVSVACVVAIIGGLVYSLYSRGGFIDSGALFSITQAVYNLIIFLAVWWLGKTLRLSREQASQLAASTEQLLQEREENARRAVFDERHLLRHGVARHGVAEAVGAWGSFWPWSCLRPYRRPLTGT